MPLDGISFRAQAGYAKLGALFRAAHVTLGDHVDFVDRLGFVPDTVGSPVFLAVDIIRLTGHCGPHTERLILATFRLGKRIPLA